MRPDGAKDRCRVSKLREQMFIAPPSPRRSKRGWPTVLDRGVDRAEALKTLAQIATVFVDARPGARHRPGAGLRQSDHLAPAVIRRDGSTSPRPEATRFASRRAGLPERLRQRQQPADNLSSAAKGVLAGLKWNVRPSSAAARRPAPLPIRSALPRRDPSEPSIISQTITCYITGRNETHRHSVLDGRRRTGSIGLAGDASGAGNFGDRLGQDAGIGEAAANAGRMPVNHRPGSFGSACRH